MSSNDGKVESENLDEGARTDSPPSDQDDTFANALRSWSGDADAADADSDPPGRGPAPMPGLKEAMASAADVAQRGHEGADPSAMWGAPPSQGGPYAGHVAGSPLYPGAAPPQAQPGWQPSHAQGQAGYPGRGHDPYGGQHTAPWPGSYPGQSPAPGQQPWPAHPPGPPGYGQYQPGPAPQSGRYGQPSYAYPPQGGLQPPQGYDQRQQWNQQWGQQASYPPMQVPQQPAIPVHQLSSRGRRLAGALLDGFLTMFICLPFAMIAAFLVGGGPISEEELGGVVLLAMIPGIMLAFVINAWLISHHGKTMAKFALGMRIVRTDGGPVDFTSGVLMRWLLPGLAAAFLPGFQIFDGLAIFSSEKRQTLHDMMARTQVIDD